MMKASNVVPFPPADQDHLSILERDGFVVLENLLDERRCRKLAEELEPWLEATPK